MEGQSWQDAGKAGAKIAWAKALPFSAQDKELAMTRDGLTEKLLDIKREKGWTWKYICEQIGGISPVLITGAILGQHKLTKPQPPPSCSACLKLSRR
jgi:hypothetical protein